MTRYARVSAPGVVHHVISRFVNREFRFIDDDDREEYLRRVSWVAKRSDWLPVAYALMSSHIHWAFLAGSGPSSDFIQPLHSGFAHWLNQKHGRLGPVFADRHSTIACDDAHAARVVVYIHNNPVRASIVKHAIESSWTSHQAYAGLVAAPRWLAVDVGARLFDLHSCETEAFDEIVRSHEGQTREWLDEPDAERLRAKVRRTLRAPVEISSPTVFEGRASVVVLSAGGRVQRPWCGDAQTVLRRVADWSGVPIEVLRSHDRRRRVAAARRLALRVWSTELRRPQTEMRALLGLSAGAASLLLRSDDGREQARLVATDLLANDCAALETEN